MSRHLDKSLELFSIWNELSEIITVNGKDLTIAHVFAVAHNKVKKITFGSGVSSRLQDNVDYLHKQIQSGAVIYGVNTGFGGNADVRSGDIQELQCALLRHLNAGFGDILPVWLIRGLMLIRCNSLSLGYSGVRPEVINLLAEMYNSDIIPVVPKRGSLSASGDLIPTSYVASCMMGRSDARVIHKGKEKSLEEAFAEEQLTAVIFQEKEALAVINSGSCAAGLASCVLYRANKAVLLTQLATALSVESLAGRLESFHPTIHKLMCHPGQQEVAANIRNMLYGSQMLADKEEHLHDVEGVLRQDRYALRSSPQWLGPVVETILESIRRIHIELNSANDNPIIDHENGEILHGANFQASSVTVAMDQARQALQMCGKLLFGQIQEILNTNLSNGLPPNLAGSDVNKDFGLKGLDLSTASYMSEIDYLTNALTNHVLSAELHNQSVNSMALVSARYTEQVLELLEMILTNIFCAHAQAVDLRWLKMKVEQILKSLMSKIHKLDNYPREYPWYSFLYEPKKTLEKFLSSYSTDGFSRDMLISETVSAIENLYQNVKDGQQREQVKLRLGKGTVVMYDHLRCDLMIPFNTGNQYPDSSLQMIHGSLQSNKMFDILKNIMDKKYT